MRPDLVVEREEARDFLGELHCRRNADKTPHHGPTRLTTTEHRGRPETWTVQHNRTRLTTTHHRCGMIPKPGVAGSIPAGGTTTFLQIGTFSFWPCGDSSPNRQNCRHFADATHAHGPAQANTRERVGFMSALTGRCLLHGIFRGPLTCP